MIYLSQISKDYTRLMTTAEIPASGNYTVKLVGSVKTLMDGVRQSINIDAVCSDELHKATGDTWHFYGLRELVEYAMIDNELPMCKIVASFKVYNPNGTQYGSDISLNETVLFCKDIVQGKTASGYLQMNSLQSNNLLFSSPGETTRIYLFTDNTDQAQDSHIYYTIRTTYFNANNEIVTVSSSAYIPTTGLGYVDIPMTLSGVSSDKIISIHFATNIKPRNITIYNLLTPRTETFRFRNRWNTEEICVIPCSIQSEPKTEYELATCNEVDVAYDIEHRTEHTLKSAPIHSQMYQTLLQLCRSHKVEYLTPSGYQRINIKEYDLPKSTEPSSTITLEMTFELAALTETIQL